LLVCEKVGAAEQLQLVLASSYFSQNHKCYNMPISIRQFLLRKFDDIEPKLSKLYDAATASAF